MGKVIPLHKTPLWKPLEAVILAVDPGRRSGVAVTAGDDLVLVDASLSTRETRRFACDTAEDEAFARQWPCIAVVETWTQHGKWSFRSALSLGEQAGRWLAEIEGRSFVAVVRVEPNEWRRALFGGGPNRKTEEWKDLAKQRVLGRFGERRDHDAAEAICMAEWASRSRRVAEALNLLESRR